MRNKKLCMAAALAGASWIFVPGIAAAQEASATAKQDAAADDGSRFGDIIVTAQRRSENIQSVPIAITAITTESMDRSAVQDLQGLQALVPGLNLGTQLGVGRVNIRGVGLENISAGSEGAIAVHLDGVYVSRTVAVLTSFYDVERVEVLRGPQGTLYGRNATGGAINVIPKGPTDDLSGYVNVTVGNYKQISGEGALSGALIPGLLSARIAFSTQNHSGYGKNIITGNGIDDLHTQAVRGTLRFTPTDRFVIDLTGDMFREDDQTGGYHYFGPGGFTAPVAPGTTPVSVVPLGLRPAWGGVVATDTRDIANEVDPQNRRDFWGLRLGMSYDLDAFKIKYVGAYRETKYVTDTDLDATSARIAPVRQQEDSRQQSHELQISGDTDRLNWVAGLYYFHEKNDGAIRVQIDTGVFAGAPTGVLSIGSFSGGRVKTDAKAAFGQASYEVVDKLKFTLGARYNVERKTVNRIIRFSLLPIPPGFDYFTSPTPGTFETRSKKWDSFTYRAGLDYQATPDTLIYGSISTGFKAGGFTLGSAVPAYDPEKVRAYEGGIKTRWLDRKVRTNIAGFYYDYKDMQIAKVVGTASPIENAANAIIYGLELEATAEVTSNFHVDGNFSWLHARFKDYVSADPARAYLGQIDLKGHTLSQSPNYTAFVGAQYTVPAEVGDFTLRGEWSWSAPAYFSPFNVPVTRQGEKNKLNAFLNFQSRDSHFNAQIFVKNITNNTTSSNIYISSGILGFPTNGFVDPPRTMGVKVGYEF